MARPAFTFRMSASLLALAALACAQPAPPKREPARLSLHSTLLNEDRRILVVLPRHHELDSGKRYPVIYKLDGDNGSTVMTAAWTF